MQVIGHDHPLIQIKVAVSPGQPLPCLVNSPSEGVQVHFLAHDIPENTPPVPGADGYEICAGLRVVVPWEADRAAASNRVQVEASSPPGRRERDAGEDHAGYNGGAGDHGGGDRRGGRSSIAGGCVRTAR